MEISQSERSKIDRQLNKVYSQLCEVLHIALEYRQTQDEESLLHLVCATQHVIKEIEYLPTDERVFCEKILGVLSEEG